MLHPSLRSGQAVARCTLHVGLLLLGLPGLPAAGQDPGLARLEREIARLAPLAAGTVGVAAVHLETGREVYFNRAERFPMASSYKVPIAVQLLTRVDGGEVRLDSLIALAPTDLHPGSGTLTELFDDPGVVLSLRNLLELMLLISDNTATDVVLRTAGGPSEVTGRMRALGVEGVRVDRPTVELIGDWVGVEQIPPAQPNTARPFGDLFRQVPDSLRAAAARRFNDDPRDTATPEGMARLLTRLWRREVLRPETSDLLLDIMLRSTTGTGRIRGLLPPETPVSHKTGTIGGTTNDVGIVTLPDSAGHVVTVVFVKGSERPVEERERAIAHIARAIHDYFLFSPVVPPPPAASRRRR
jgi:beta-lactamase class A